MSELLGAGEWGLVYPWPMSDAPASTVAPERSDATTPAAERELVLATARRAKEADDLATQIEKYRKRWWSKRKGLWTMLKEEATKQESALLDSAAANKAADADAALEELGDDLVGFGYLTSTVTVWDRDLQHARRKLQAVKQGL